MREVWYDKNQRMYVEVQTGQEGVCLICGIKGSRPHTHPAYELSMWFPPVVVAHDTTIIRQGN